MINLHAVQKFYPPDLPALDGVDLKVYPGEFVFLAGASGAGKSTLMRLLFGAEKPTDGQVVVGGRNLSSGGVDDIAALRRDIGVVFQDYKLLENRTVVDNVAYGLEARGIDADQRRSLAMRMLEAVDLEDKADAYPKSLSGGEQQRVAIGRALLHKPRLILADEPTGNLDAEMSNVVFDLLLEAHAQGVTVVVATHNLAIIEELNLRTVVLDQGKIIGDFESPRGMQ